MVKGNQTQEKKIEIMRAATALIKKRGLQALSFEAVANESGLSRQLVRYYFTDLDALILELCTYLANGYRDILVAGVLDVGQVERLKFFLDFFFDLADQHPMPNNIEVYDSLLAYAVGSEDLRERLCDQYKTLGQVIVHELAIAHPELDGHSCEELAYLFVAMMHAHWSFVASLGYSRDHGRLTRRAMDRLIKSYINDSSEGRSIDAPWSRDA